MNIADPGGISPPVSVRSNLQPGDVGYIVYLHGTIYSREQGFDYTFDSYVAGPLAEFARSCSPRERIWIVESDGKIVGSVAVVRFSDDRAQLRWFLLDPCVRGLGIGRMLLGKALEFCRSAGYSSVFLWTVDALKPAMNLYQSHGFEPAQELTHELWGKVITEIKYELMLRPHSEA